MADVSVKFSISKGILAQLRDELFTALGKKGRGNFGDIRPVVAESIDRAIESKRSLFVPNDREAAELGVGVGGQIDRKRTQDAYSQMHTDEPAKITTFSVQKAGRSRSALIGRIRADVDFERLFDSDLATVPTESEFSGFENIPWLRWLIHGAPRVAGFSFDPRRTSEVSRTGRGLMIQLPGGLWTFPPARPGAQEILLEQMQRNIEADIGRKVGDILNA